METSIQLLLLLGLVAISTGCASPYMVDRGRDLADIFSAGVGPGITAQARVGPIAAGFGGQDIRLGLESGEFFLAESAQHDVLHYVCFLSGTCAYIFPPSMLLPGFAGQRTVHPNSWRDRERVTISDLRNKNYCVSSYFLFDSYYHDIEYLRFKGPEPFYAKLRSNTQIEAGISLIVTIRIGCNPLELLDFILGWFSVDIFHDDLERRKLESNKTQEPIVAYAPKSHC